MSRWTYAAGVATWCGHAGVGVPHVACAALRPRRRTACPLRVLDTGLVGHGTARCRNEARSGAGWPFRLGERSVALRDAVACHRLSCRAERVIVAAVIRADSARGDGHDVCIAGARRVRRRSARAGLGLGGLAAPAYAGTHGPPSRSPSSRRRSGRTAARSAQPRRVATVTGGTRCARAPSGRSGSARRTGLRGTRAGCADRLSAAVVVPGRLPCARFGLARAEPSRGSPRSGGRRPRRRGPAGQRGFQPRVLVTVISMTTRSGLTRGVRYRSAYSRSA